MKSLFVISMLALAACSPTTATSNPSSQRVREVLSHPGANGHPPTVQKTDYSTGPYMTPQ